MPDKNFFGDDGAGARFSRLKRPVWHCPRSTPPLNHNSNLGCHLKQLLYCREGTTVGKKIFNKKNMKGFFSNTDFWKEALLFLGVVCLFYLIWVVVEYWPEIVQGFNRGWSGE